MKVGFPGILFVVFLVLKLTGAIGWSWSWWVTAPIWGLFVLWFVIIVLIKAVSKR